MVATSQSAESFAAQLAILHDHDCWARLGEIRARALVLVAESDVFIRPDLSRRMLERLPDARWASVAGGHAVMWENPSAWNGAIVAFVQDQARAAGTPGGSHDRT
jgi:3-oxoadipate enol-lactonase